MQKLVQVTLMKLVAGFSPAGIERVAGHFELCRLPAQFGQAVNGIAERGILLAALLGPVIVAP
ncbi:hypothetical protein D3C77_637220 [compost metagenome]